MAIVAKTLLDQFAVFKERIFRKGKQPFISFREGLAEEWEGYKLPLREKALVRLGASTWSQSAIGTGQILKRLIAAIEIPDTSPTQRDGNNLVRWPNEYGHRNRSHYALLDAQINPTECRRVEQWAFELYRGEPNFCTAFEDLRAITG